MRVTLLLLAILAIETASGQRIREGARAHVRQVKREATGVDVQKQYLSKMTTCVRNRFGSTSPHTLKQERCAYRHMKRALETRDRVSCKSCDRSVYLHLVPVLIRFIMLIMSAASSTVPPVRRRKRTAVHTTTSKRHWKRSLTAPKSATWGLIRTSRRQRQWLRAGRQDRVTGATCVQRDAALPATTKHAL